MFIVDLRQLTFDYGTPIIVEQLQKTLKVVKHNHTFFLFIFIVKATLIQVFIDLNVV